MTPTAAGPGRFAGTGVLLTGALGSLGRAQARAFAAEGARVVLLDVPARTADGDALAAELGGGARYVGHDLADLAGTEALAAELAAEPGGIDVLVHDAALIVNRPFTEFSIAEHEEQLRVNASAAFALVRGCAPGMRARRRGSIVLLTSLTLNGRWDGYVPYVASKGALLGLMKGLARELGPDGIRVNAVAPGAVVSEAEARVFGDRAEAYAAWILENQSLKERIVPEDVAHLVLFLASDAARMISGQNVGIDGGW